jgi:hypothetical protein
MNNSLSRGDALPLPGWNFPPRPFHSSPRRTWQRFSRICHATSLANNLVHSLNRLNHYEEAASCTLPVFPHLSRENQHRQHYLFKVSAAQRSAAQEILRASWNLVRRTHCDDRLRDHTQTAAHLLSALLHSHTLNSNDTAHFTDSDNSDAFAYVNGQRPRMPIVADRLALPASSRSVGIISTLRGEQRLRYSAPEHILRQDPPLVMPSAPVFASHEQYVQTLLRLSSLDMLGLTHNPRAINGLFAIDKGDGTQRLIVDARPANSLFVEPEPVKLPLPDLISSLAPVSAHGTQPAATYACKVDIEAFFHSFRLPDDFLPYFALPPVRPSELGIQCAGDEPIFPCLNRLPMGWNHSVVLAQSAHENLLNDSGFLQASDRITTDTDSHIDRVRHAVYIDDLILFATDPVLLARVQRRYIEYIELAGFRVKPSKVVLPSCDGVDVLGLEFNGRNHSYGLRASKLIRLVLRTQDLVHRGFSSGRELASTIGAWTWAMLVRRPALAAFSAVYRFINCADTRTFMLWPSVVHELQTASGLAPLLQVNLEAKFFKQAIATDASIEGFGVVVADIPSNNQQDAATAAGLGNNDQVTSQQTEAIKVLATARWRTVISAKWRRPLHHINEGELRAVSTAFRWVSSRPSSRGSKILCFCDNTAVVGALSKGRTSSFNLLSLLRPLSAILLLFDYRLFTVWVPSACNPADRPSRVF